MRTVSFFIFYFKNMASSSLSSLQNPLASTMSRLMMNYILRDLSWRRRIYNHLKSSVFHNRRILIIFFTLIAIGANSFTFSKEPKILIPLSGRLGNQLFQLAASVQIKERTDSQVIWKENLYSKETDYRRTIFKEMPISSSERHACGWKTPKFLPKIARDCSNLNDILAQVEDCSVIKGLFQCADVAERGLSVVEKVLQKQELEYLGATERITTARNDALSGSALVAMHIRRGDYTKRFNRKLLEPLPIAYYKKAMKLMPPNSTFLVFSDDIKWCRGAFFEEKMAGTRIVYMRVINPIEALLTMAMADHHIIANSTFSWWAAFLYQRLQHIVVAPIPWYGPRVKDPFAILPDKWTIINITELETTST